MTHLFGLIIFLMGFGVLGIIMQNRVSRHQHTPLLFWGGLGSLAGYFIHLPMVVNIFLFPICICIAIYVFQNPNIVEMFYVKSQLLAYILAVISGIIMLFGIVVLIFGIAPDIRRFWQEMRFVLYLGRFASSISGILMGVVCFVLGSPIFAVRRYAIGGEEKRKQKSAQIEIDYRNSIRKRNAVNMMRIEAEMGEPEFGLNDLEWLTASTFIVEKTEDLNQNLFININGCIHFIKEKNGVNLIGGETVKIAMDNLNDGRIDEGDILIVEKQ